MMLHRPTLYKELRAGEPFRMADGREAKKIDEATWEVAGVRSPANSIYLCYPLYWSHAVIRSYGRRKVKENVDPKDYITQTPIHELVDLEDRLPNVNFACTCGRWFSGTVARTKAEFERAHQLAHEEFNRHAASDSFDEGPEVSAGHRAYEMRENNRKRREHFKKMGMAEPTLEALEKDFIAGQPDYYVVRIIVKREWSDALGLVTYGDQFGGFTHGAEQRLSFDSAMKAKEHIMREYGHFIDDIDVLPAQEQGQMYSQGRRWPQEFESLDPKGYIMGQNVTYMVVKNYGASGRMFWDDKLQTWYPFDTEGRRVVGIPPTSKYSYEYAVALAHRLGGFSGRDAITVEPSLEHLPKLKESEEKDFIMQQRVPYVVRVKYKLGEVPESSWHYLDADGQFYTAGVFLTGGKQKSLMRFDTTADASRVYEINVNRQRKNKELTPAKVEFVPVTMMESQEKDFILNLPDAHDLNAGVYIRLDNSAIAREQGGPMGIKGMESSHFWFSDPEGHWSRNPYRMPFSTAARLIHAKRKDYPPEKGHKVTIVNDPWVVEAIDPKKFIVNQPEFSSPLERWLLDNGFRREGKRYRHPVKGGEVQVWKAEGDNEWTLSLYKSEGHSLVQQQLERYPAEELKACLVHRRVVRKQPVMTESTEKDFILSTHVPWVVRMRYHRQVPSIPWQYLCKTGFKYVEYLDDEEIVKFNTEQEAVNASNTLYPPPDRTVEVVPWTTLMREKRHPNTIREGHNNTLIGSVACVYKNKVALVKGKNGWTLPGGRAEDDESVFHAAARECEEECGVSVKPADLLFVGMVQRSKHRIDSIFVVELEKEQTVKAGSDADEAMWVSLDKLPRLGFGHASAIKKALRVLKMKPGERGQLVVFEGVDGAGKTTQVERTIEWLKRHGFPVVTTKWASSPLMGSAIKKGKKKRELSPVLYHLMHSADLLHRYEQIICPALARNFVVVCDRYWPTGVVRDRLRGVKNKSCYAKLRKPDVLFYCAVKPEVAVKRLMKAGRLSWYGIGMDIAYADDEHENATEYSQRMAKLYKRVLPRHVPVQMDRKVGDIWDEVKDKLETTLAAHYYRGQNLMERAQAVAAYLLEVDVRNFIGTQEPEYCLAATRLKDGETVYRSLAGWKTDKTRADSWPAGLADINLRQVREHEASYKEQFVKDFRLELMENPYDPMDAYRNHPLAQEIERRRLGEGVDFVKDFITRQPVIYNIVGTRVRTNEKVYWTFGHSWETPELVAIGAHPKWRGGGNSAEQWVKMLQFEQDNYAPAVTDIHHEAELKESEDPKDFILSQPFTPYLVKFTRYSEEDWEQAQENFPDESLEDALRHQFELELDHNDQLRGKYTIVQAGWNEGKSHFILLVRFAVNMTQVQFYNLLQSTYDVHGMAGEWEFVDEPVNEGVDAKRYIMRVAPTRFIVTGEHNGVPVWAHSAFSGSKIYYVGGRDNATVFGPEAPEILRLLRDQDWVENQRLEPVWDVSPTTESVDPKAFMDQTNQGAQATVSDKLKQLGFEQVQPDDLWDEVLLDDTVESAWRRKYTYSNKGKEYNGAYRFLMSGNLAAACDSYSGLFMDADVFARGFPEEVLAKMVERIRRRGTVKEAIDPRHEILHGKNHWELRLRPKAEVPKEEPPSTQVIDFFCNGENVGNFFVELDKHPEFPPIDKRLLQYWKDQIEALDSRDQFRVTDWPNHMIWEWLAKHSLTLDRPFRHTAGHVYGQNRRERLKLLGWLKEADEVKSFIMRSRSPRCRIISKSPTNGRKLWLRRYDTKGAVAWSYREDEGIVYPAKVAQERLALLRRRFDWMQIDLEPVYGLGESEEKAFIMQNEPESWRIGGTDPEGVRRWLTNEFTTDGDWTSDATKATVYTTRKGVDHVVADIIRLGTWLTDVRAEPFDWTPKSGYLRWQGHAEER